MKVGQNGEIILTEEQSRNWALKPGDEVSIIDTPDGLLITPSEIPLRKVYVEPTTLCNLACGTCMRNTWEEPLGSMEMGTYRSLLHGLRDIPTLKTMAFWGIGEPLVHPHIVEMIGEAKDLGVKTELITNGLLLNPEVAEGLVLAGLDTLVVSVDGTTPETHEAIRPGANLSKVRENMNRLRAISRKHFSQTPKIGIEYVLTRRNISELSGLRQLAYSMGASFIILTNILPYTEEFKDEILYWSSTRSSYSFPGSQWIPEITLPRIDAKLEYLTALSGVLKHGGGIDLLPRRLGRSYDRCPFIWDGTTAVGWNGETSPCIALMHSCTCYVMGREKFIRRYSVGNVAQERITTIWDSQEYKDFRRRVLKFDFSPCATCSGCKLSGSNEEDCFGNTFPVCGDCLWAKGIILCP